MRCVRETSCERAGCRALGGGQARACGDLHADPREPVRSCARADYETAASFWLQLVGKFYEAHFRERDPNFRRGFENIIFVFWSRVGIGASRCWEMGNERAHDRVSWAQGSVRTRR